MGIPKLVRRYLYIEVYNACMYLKAKFSNLNREVFYPSSLGLVMAWCRTSDKPLSELLMSTIHDATVGCIHEFGPVCLRLSRWFQWHICLSELLSRWNIISLYITIRMNAWSRSLWNMDGRLSRYSSGYRNELNDTLSFNCLAHNCFCWNEWNKTRNKWYLQKQWWLNLCG